LLVHELSRLSRTVYDTLDIFELLGKNGVGFASVRDPDFDFADPSKRLFLTIIAAINEYYIVLLRQHTSKAKRERARQGLYNASVAPYGYQHTGGAQEPPVILEAEAAAVRLAFETYATGRYSDINVAELLNQHGFKVRSGRRFSKDTVSGILTNPFYIGKVIYCSRDNEGVEVFDGQHEPLIPEDLWERCMSWRESRRNLSRSIQKEFRVYLLSNLVVCDVCGRKLRAQGALSGTYYREMSYERGFTDCPHQRIGTRTEVVDHQIRTLIRSIRLPAEWLEEAGQRVGNDDETHELQRQRERLEAERRRLQQMRLSGDFDDNFDYYRSELARIRRQLNSLPTHDQLESLRMTANAIKDLYEVWENADPGDQRELLRLMINEITVDVPNGRVVTISPLAVFLPIFRQIPMLNEIEFGSFAFNWDIASLDQKFPPLPVLEVQARIPPGDNQLLFFSNAYPLAPSPDTRLDSGISKALSFLRARDHYAQVMTQVQTKDWPLLPMDTRRRPGLSARVVSRAQALDTNKQSIDVLVTQGLLWENALDKQCLTEDLITSVGEKLNSKGIWYMVEPLPLDAPAHWAFRFFPTAFDWYKANTWTLHNLYMLIQRLGYKAVCKRHIYRQPVTLGAVNEIARRRLGILARLADRTFEHGLNLIAEKSAAAGSDFVIGSEFALLEAWIQK
jgi:site-specific DNA recombinase